MIIRFWKFCLTFHKYELHQGWMFGVTYIDGGLHFTLYKYEMDFDWGYNYSEFSYGTINDY